MLTRFRKINVLNRTKRPILFHCDPLIRLAILTFSMRRRRYYTDLLESELAAVRSDAVLRTFKLGAAMATLDEKIARVEACVRELAQDREDFDRGKIALQLDARIVKTWVWQLDQVLSLLTAMLDDWKEISAHNPECEKHRAESPGNGIPGQKSGIS